MPDLKPTDQEIAALIDTAFDNYRGSSETFKGAIGYAFVARRIGWKPALLMHTQRTIKEYDRILGIDSRSVFPEIGPDADRSVAWRVAQSVTNFWKAVKGEIKGVRSTELD